MDAPLTPAAIGELISRVKTAQLRLYQAAAQFLPEHRRLWQILQVDCESHAIIIGKAAAAAAANPGRWQVQPFTVQVPNLLVTEMAAKTAELAAGTINRRYAVTFMADAEKSLIDAKLYDALRTDQLDGSAQLDSIKNESLTHVAKLRELLPQLS
ncbi:MAG TPA: hypothetical protein PKM88_15150 [bacterium]|nr:hypothetical protein [bacterium]